MALTGNTGITEQWAQGIFERDRAKVRGALDSLSAWNFKNPEAVIRVTPVQVHSRVREMALGHTTRILKSAPKELRGGVADALR